jgi:uncharacterized membrane protein SpoIIM required for sporulation
MFVPIVGQIVGYIALYNTGSVIAGYANVKNVSGALSFLTLFIWPHTWLEFIAYSIAMASSVWLIWRTVRHEATRELSRTALFILICGALLLLAAFLEAYVVSLFLKT